MAEMEKILFMFMELLTYQNYDLLSIEHVEIRSDVTF